MHKELMKAAVITLALTLFVSLMCNFITWNGKSQAIASDGSKTLYVGAGSASERFNNIKYVQPSKLSASTWTAYDMNDKPVVTMGLNNWYLKEN